MNKAPKKPILKPFREEQQSPMGPDTVLQKHRTKAQTANNPRMQISEGMQSLSFHHM